MKNKFVPIIIILVILFLIAVAVYNRNTPNSKIQKTADISTETSLTASESLPETSWANEATQSAGTSTATTTEATQVTTSTTSTAESSSETPETTTAQDIAKNLPTLKLVIYEGPVLVQDSDIVYYRVEARATGIPAPFINFSRDDSGGVWGKNISQINLKNGESYDLVVTATNTSGSVKKHIVLTWN